MLSDWWHSSEENSSDWSKAVTYRSYILTQAFEETYFALKSRSQVSIRSDKFEMDLNFQTINLTL